MKLFELTQIIDEGPRQDRAEQLFTEYKDLLDTKGPTEFRRAVMNALMQEFGLSQANASNIYTSQMKKSGVTGLSNAERRAAAGKEPVKARVKGGAMSDLPSDASIGEPVAADSHKSEEQDDAEVKALLTDTDHFDGLVDEDDFEWDRVQDTDGNLVIEWTYQFNHSSAVDAVKENRDEITSANNQLAAVGKKYRDRVVSYKPETLERAVKADEQFKGKPDTVRRLRGQIVLSL